MAFVIAIAQQKGGAGKSTVAANLAATLAAGRQKIALLDTDPQASLSRWAALREGREGVAAISFEAPSGWRVTGAIERLKRDHDVVIMDTAPHADTDSKVAIRAADLVIIPMQPAGPDLWASEATLKLAAAEKKPARILLNRVPAQGRLKDVIMAELAARKLELLGPGLGNRTAYATAFMQGLGVSEAAARSAAAEEIAATIVALRALMKG
ncbi:MAG: ParA family protein [Alphaproteobacteria bacterium]|nr:ParA family protein [Alphaproteobacteria bacterium]